MGDFSYFSTLPKCLDKKEQEILLYEMAKLKDEYEKTGNVDTQKKYLGIREKLITHNLKICSDFAIKYCQKYGRMQEVEDFYDECTTELIRAIDDYDQSRGFSFATLAHKYMNTRLLNLFSENQNDALNMKCDVEILNKNEEEIEDGFFAFLSDGCDISENFAQKEFVADLINYINNIENERNRLALKMFIGLGYKRKYTQIEIAKVLGCSRSLIAKIVIDEKEKLKEYIATNYSQFFPDIAKEVKDSQFAKNAKKKKYLFYSFYGLHGLEKKDIDELSAELGISVSVAHDVINKKLATLSEKKKEKLQLEEIKPNIKLKVKYDDDLLVSVFNDYYGLENRPMLSSEELLKKYNISIEELYYILEKAKKELNIEERNQLKEKRKTYIDDKKLEKCALCYIMSKGLKGYEKTSQLEIAKEFGIDRRKVSQSIKKYQAYLDSLTPEEREKLLGEDVVPEQ